MKLVASQVTSPDLAKYEAFILNLHRQNCAFYLNEETAQK